MELQVGSDATRAMHQHRTQQAFLRASLGATTSKTTQVPQHQTLLKPSNFASHRNLTFLPALTFEPTPLHFPLFNPPSTSHLPSSNPPSAYYNITIQLSFHLPLSSPPSTSHLPSSNPPFTYHNPTIQPSFHLPQSHHSTLLLPPTIQLLFNSSPS